MAFRPKTPEELHAQDDDAILRYMVEARRMRLREHEREAQQVLIYKHRPDMRRKVANKLYDFPDHVIDDVTDRAFVGALTSAVRAPFREATVNQFKAWRNRIVGNTIADFFDSAEPRRIRSTEYLGAARTGDDGSPWGHEPGVEGHEADVVDRMEAADRAVPIEARLDAIAARDPARARAMRAVLGDELDAAGAAARYNRETGGDVKPNTVDQWVSRLRRESRGDDEVTA